MIDYAKSLNPAQYEAVTCHEDSVLVVAGAGSGKTRAITYRLAWLVEHGINPASILLLTFTRKAAQEMLARAAALLGEDLCDISGGTFHAFAYGALKRHPPRWLGSRPFTLLDSTDVTQALRQCREDLKLAKKDSSFPKIATIAGIFSKARNKELSVTTILQNDYYHLLPHAEALESLNSAYRTFRRDKRLLDYDDLLFELEDLLLNDPDGANYIKSGLSHILVDEYQDTNLVQARLVRLLATENNFLRAKIMAVGDESQSIYAFRGANVRNMLDFKLFFPDTRIITLEENYRSTQPILNVANNILANAAESFRKNLFSARKEGEAVRIINPLSDTSQAQIITQRIEELLAENRPHEIAVLFRSGYHSYPLENALRKAGISFRKYGGLRFIEASHVKDILSFARLVLNPLDILAFNRICAMHKGIGPKTAQRLYGLLANNDREKLPKALGKFPSLLEDLNFLNRFHAHNIDPYALLAEIVEYYRPRLETLYPEDWPSRLPGLDEIAQMSANYTSLDQFIADMALDTPPEESAIDLENCVTLSTIHSAKGLEWNAVLLIDLVEDRFPSRHAAAKPEDFEEERRLFYVACTRAKNSLELYAPATVFNKTFQGSMPVAESPFLKELPPDCAIRYKEKLGGILERKKTVTDYTPLASSVRKTEKKTSRNGTGYCRHRIFGRGKIVKIIDDEKMQVNFPGFGLKIILSDYLIMED